MTETERTISNLLDHSVKEGKTFEVEVRLGKAYASISQTLLAIRHYAFAMELTQDKSQIWDLLVKQGHLQRNLGNYSTAIGLFMRAFALFKDRPESMYHLICTLEMVHGTKAAASMLECLPHPDKISDYPGAELPIQEWATSSLVLVYAYYGTARHNTDYHMFRLLNRCRSLPANVWNNFSFYRTYLDLTPAPEPIDRINSLEVNVEDPALIETPLRGLLPFECCFSKHIHVDKELWTIMTVKDRPGYVCLIARCDESLTLKRHSGLTYINHDVPFVVKELRIEDDDVKVAIDAGRELNWMSCPRVVIDQMLSSFTYNGKP